MNGQLDSSESRYFSHLYVTIAPLCRSAKLDQCYIGVRT